MTMFGNNRKKSNVDEFYDSLKGRDEYLLKHGPGSRPPTPAGSYAFIKQWECDMSRELDLAQSLKEAQRQDALAERQEQYDALNNIADKYQKPLPLIPPTPKLPIITRPNYLQSDEPDDFWD